METHQKRREDRVKDYVALHLGRLPPDQVVDIMLHFLNCDECYRQYRAVLESLGVVVPP